MSVPRSDREQPLLLHTGPSQLRLFQSRTDAAGRTVRPLASDFAFRRRPSPGLAPVRKLHASLLLEPGGWPGGSRISCVFTLAPILYRRITAPLGGPIASVTVGEFPFFGRRLLQATARLCPNLVPPPAPHVLYSTADGTGTAESPSLARFKAISEALERWAYRTKVGAPDRELYGFTLDESSSGMAAFPGLTHRPARRHALLEAVERASLFAWWEGITDAEPFATDYPAIRAIALPSPVGIGVTILAYRRSDDGSYAYGHAAALKPTTACHAATIELSRHEHVVKTYHTRSRSGPGAAPQHLFERRALFFSTEAGYALFEERLHRPPKGRRFASRLVCDTEVIGPWSRYATVWRALIEPPSQEFLSDTERYFFW